MTQNQEFQARLSRLNGGGGTVAQPTLDVGQGNPQQRRAKKRPINDWRENIKYPAKIVGAFLLGMLAVFATRYVRFHINGGSMTGEDADLMMMIDGGMALVIAFGLKSLFRLEAPEFKLAQTAGILAMVCTMHNAVHFAPKPFAMLFSPEWVAEVVEYTEPKSILFRGVSFAMSGEETQVNPTGEEPAEIPQFIKLDSEK